MDTDFKEVMSKRTDEELIKIITVDRDGYQTFAVAAAEEEIKKRNLTTTQIEQVTGELTARTEEKKQRVEKTARFIAELVDTFHPFQKETPTTERIIKLISIFFGVLFFYKLYKEFGVFRFAFFIDDNDWDWSMILFIIPFVVLPATGVLFWFRKKVGWMLAAIYSSYTTAGAIQMFIIALIHKPSGIPTLDIIYPAVSPAVCTGILLLFGGLTLCLCRKNIRTVYRTGKKAMLTALGLGAGIVVLLTFGIRFL